MNWNLERLRKENTENPEYLKNNFNRVKGGEA
jgi:hypothetical protein